MVLIWLLLSMNVLCKNGLCVRVCRCVCACVCVCVCVLCDILGLRIQLNEWRDTHAHTYKIFPFSGSDQPCTYTLDGFRILSSEICTSGSRHNWKQIIWNCARCFHPRRCKTSSVGQSAGLSVRRSPVRFRQTPPKSRTSSKRRDHISSDPKYTNRSMFREEASCKRISTSSTVDSEILWHSAYFK